VKQDKRLINEAEGFEQYINDTIALENNNPGIVTHQEAYHKRKYNHQQKEVTQPWPRPPKNVSYRVSDQYRGQRGEKADLERDPHYFGIKRVFEEIEIMFEGEVRAEKAAH
jgi:hypothetical protein